MRMKRLAAGALALALTLGVLGTAYAGEETPAPPLTATPTPAPGTALEVGSEAYLNTAARADKRGRPRTAMRELASPGAALVFEYFNGTPVEVLGMPWRGYAHVRVGGAEGYVDAEALDLTPLGPALVPPGGEVSLTPGRDALPLLAAPDADAQVLASYGDGDTVEVLGVRNDWLHVRVEDRLGYMDARYVSEAGEGRHGRFLGSSSQPVNLRTGPDIRTRSKGRYYAVTFDYLFDAYNDAHWNRIRVGDTVGYLSTIYAVEPDIDDPYMGMSAPGERDIAAGEDGVVSLYAAPEADAEVLATLEPGGKVLPLGIVGDAWYHVWAVDGLYGYIPKEAMGKGR